MGPYLPPSQHITPLPPQLLHVGLYLTEKLQEPPPSRELSKVIPDYKQQRVDFCGVKILINPRNFAGISVFCCQCGVFNKYITFYS